MLTSDQVEARAELERRAAARSSVGPASLMDWIPWARPERVWGGKPYVAPRHLAPLLAILAKTETTTVNAVVSVPCRHGKSDTLLAWCVQRLLRQPSLKIAYFSYAADFAATRCARAKRLAQAVGIELDGRDREDYFETAAGGFLRSGGIQGQHAGMGYNVIVVDDPHKDLAEAESETVRTRVNEAFANDIWTRRDPAGTSVIVCGARRHVEDLPGVLLQRGWPYVGLPAIDDSDGTERALWPEVWSLDALKEIRDGANMGAHEWNATYQGNPVPRGGAVFHAPTYCDELPTDGYQAAIGVDLAYSAKTHADKSVSIVLGKRREPSDTDKERVRYYVLDVVSRQVEAPQFVAVLREHAAAYPGAGMRWYASGTEKGAGDFIRASGVRLEVRPATADKFVRAQPTAAAWNAGQIVVPRRAAWATAFVDEVCRFTGVGDAHDDHVDALAAAFDQLRRPKAKILR